MNLSRILVQASRMELVVEANGRVRGVRSLPVDLVLRS